MDPRVEADQILASDDWAETADLLAGHDPAGLQAIAAELRKRLDLPDADHERLQAEIDFVEATAAEGIGPALFHLRVRLRTDEAALLRDRHHTRPPGTPTEQLVQEVGELAEFLYYALFEVTEDPDVLTEVVDLCRHALRLSLTTEQRWVFRNLGSMASRQRFVLSTDPEDLRRAIAWGRHALDDAATIEEEASSRCVLANALFDRWSRTGRRADIDDAIAHYRHVLNGAADGVLANVDEIERNLLAALHDRWRRYGDDDDRAQLDDKLNTTPIDASAADSGEVDMTRDRLRAARDSTSSIAALTAARRHYDNMASDEPQRTAVAQHLGALAVEVYQSTGALETIVEAIGWHRSSLAHTPDQSADRSTREANFVAAGLELLEKQTDADLLHECYQRAADALARTPDRSPDMAIFLGLFANAAMTRFEHEGQIADLLDAEAASIRGYQLTKPPSPTYPGMADRVCTVQRMTADVLVDDDRLAAAIRAGRRATATCELDDPRRPVYLGNLGLALADAADKAFPSTNLRRAAGKGGRQEAIRLLEESVTSSDPASPDHVTFLSNLASTWAEQWYEDRTDHAATQADQSYQRALDLAADSAGNQVERIRVLANRAALAYAVANHTDNNDGRDEASASFRHVLADPDAAVAETALVGAGAWGSSASTAQRWDEALRAYRHATELGLRLTAMQSSDRDRLQRLRQLTGLGTNGAIAALKAGQPDQALQLIHDNRQVLTRLASSSGTRRPATGSRRRPQQVRTLGPTSYLLAGNVEGMILIDDNGSISTHDAPDLTASHVEQHARPYFAAFNNRHDDPNTWRDQIEIMSRWLAHAAMDTITSHHPPDSTINLVTSGMLSLLPLHAATGHPPADHALDTHPIRYRTTTPTAPAPGSSAYSDRLVVIAGPTPDLEWSNDEITWTSRHFDNVTTLHEPASLDDVDQALTNADVIHISAHGDLDTGDPLNSALVLGPAGPLTTDHVRQLSIGAQLVFLSACDTGLAWYRAPDEVLGIHTAFIQAGAQTVISAAWSVPEFATALLVGKFYETLRTTHAVPHDALQSAQLWVRDATNQEKADWMGLDRTVNAPNRRQHQHPYFWAGFSVLT